MSKFHWIEVLPDIAWEMGESAGRGVRMDLQEFARRSGAVSPRQAIADFRIWAFAQKRRHYCIAWTEPGDAEDVLLLLRN